jgi:hypothetical protein
MDTIKSQLQPQLHWHTRVGLAVSVSALCGAYLHAVTRRTGPQQLALRLLLTWPLLALNLWLPLLFDSYDELLSRGIVCFLASWLGCFKARGTRSCEGALADRAPNGGAVYWSRCSPQARRRGRLGGVRPWRAPQLSVSGGR